VLDHAVDSKLNKLHLGCSGHRNDLFYICLSFDVWFGLTDFLLFSLQPGSLLKMSKKFAKALTQKDL